MATIGLEVVDAALIAVRDGACVEIGRAHV